MNIQGDKFSDVGPHIFKICPLPRLAKLANWLVSDNHTQSCRLLWLNRNSASARVELWDRILLISLSAFVLLFRLSKWLLIRLIITKNRSIGISPGVISNSDSKRRAIFVILVTKAALISRFSSYIWSWMAWKKRPIKQISQKNSSKNGENRPIQNCAAREILSGLLNLALRLNVCLMKQICIFKRLLLGRYTVQVRTKNNERLHVHTHML